MSFIPSYLIWIFFVPWKFVHSSVIAFLLHFSTMSTHVFSFFFSCPLLLVNAFVSRLFKLRKLTTILLSVSTNQQLSPDFVHLSMTFILWCFVSCAFALFLPIKRHLKNRDSVLFITGSLQNQHNDLYILGAQ